MKLYHSPTSPYVRKVMVVLHETGQLEDVTLEATTGTPLAPAAGLVAKNPLTKVPALERPDGCTLYDSRVICRFLDARAKAGLYPQGARGWETLTLEATGDGITDAALLMTYEARLRPEGQRMDAFVDAQWEKIENACAALNARWISHLSGPLDAGQIAVGCALAYVDFRHEARGWRNGNDALAAWYAGFAERGSMRTTTPPA
ncbi:glutathione S-transferase [Primorskyibacter flagellatus]|uniref:Glutathione S-transferase n=1 Tax=Primorskyibacter flagellatus TaxID=1387277 RepID=A0A1W1ZSN2_9RHOB|nr:glutathione S-transferase [Primorskyibacter flagellatus]SMC51078.1 Glutathione S-transferase [Primorskyibacter flagellatus]